MKIRSQFVSNSSSTSFCVVGVSDSDYIKMICEKIGIDPGIDYPDSNYVGHGVYISDDLDLLIYGCSSYVEAIGFDAKSYLEKNTLSYMKKLFHAYILENYGIDIPIHLIGLEFGESGG